MLQDLDKRGSGVVGSDTAHAQIRAVPEQNSKWGPVWYAALLLTVILAAIGAWWFLRHTEPVVATPVVLLQPSQARVLPRTSNLGISLAIASYPLLQKKREVVPVSTVPAAPDRSLGKTPEPKPAPVKSVTGTLPDKPPVAAVQTTVGLPDVKISSPQVSAGINKNLKEPKDVNADENSRGFKQAKEVTPQQHTENAYRKAL